MSVSVAKPPSNASVAMDVDVDEGIVQPSDPEIKKIIDNTAKWVVKSGDDFEQKIMKLQAQNPQFSFLFAGNGYYAYYQQKIRTIRRTESTKSSEDFQSEIEKKLKLKKALLGELPMEEVESAVKRKKTEEIEIEPPPKEEWVIEKPAIGAQQDDILKLSAQFVARNGRAFQNGLLAREHNNALFAFLQPFHPLHHYFKSLVQQYTAVLLPEKKMLEELKEKGLEKQAIVDRVMKKVQYERVQKKDLDRKRKREEVERTQMQQIDWHDFVIVQTIELEDPATEEEPANDAMEVVESNTATAVPNVQEEAEPERVKVDNVALPDEDVEMEDVATSDVTNYNPRANFNSGQSNKLQYVTPSGQNVDLSDMEEHMKIELANLRALEERKKKEAAQMPSNLAEGKDILSSLKGFKSRRSDIFSGSEQTQEKKATPKRTVWDGHAASVDRVTAEAAKGTNVMDQIRQIHSQKGISEGAQLGPQVQTQNASSTQTIASSQQQRQQSVLASGAPTSNSNPSRSIGVGVTASASDGGAPPPYKKARTSINGLVPEDEWINTHPDPIHLTIRLPQQEHESWKLNGQSLTIKLSVAETVKALKSKIKEATSMPANKQKLTSSIHGALKDASKLAHYNVYEGMAIELSVKARGGRKK